SMAEIAALRARLDKLPRKQYQLAQVLLNTPEMIMFGSVRELASQLDVNNATIIRFAQSLGYSGYQALQSALRQAYLPRAGLQPPRDTSGLDNPESAAEATFAQHQANLQLAQQHLLNADFGAISDLLVHARRIIVAASGSSVVPGMLMVRLLRHVGLRGELVSEGGVEREIALYDAGPEDVVIGIGFWLTYRGVVEALALARRQGAKTIAITGSPTSPLRQVADHLLIAPAQGTAFSFSSVATIAVVEIIVSHIAARRPQRTAEVSQHLHDRYLEEHLLAPLLASDEK
ncbi:MAG: MurR/RpiR family transcriptional regulator, partial [Thermomicrobiales bacterium]